MDDILDEPGDLAKVFKDKAMWIGTFLGGPLAAGYMFNENNKALGREDKIGITWVYAVFATLAILAIAIFLPEDIPIPNFVIPVAYTLATVQLYKVTQQVEVDRKVNLGAQTKPWWHVLIAGLVGLIITFGILLLVVVVFGLE